MSLYSFWCDGKVRFMTNIKELLSIMEACKMRKKIKNLMHSLLNSKVVSSSVCYIIFLGFTMIVKICHDIILLNKYIRQPLISYMQMRRSWVHIMDHGTHPDPPNTQLPHTHTYIHTHNTHTHLHIYTYECMHIRLSKENLLKIALEKISK